MNKAQTNKMRWYRDGEGFWACFCMKGYEMQGMVDNFKEGTVYDLILKKHRNHRSLDANGYFWSLLNQLSEVVGEPPMTMYRQYILDVGGNYVIVPVREDAIKEWDRIWCAGHDGRLTVDMGECRNIQGYHNMRSYIGSSDYDTAQMSRLIELVIADCKEYGIDTLTDKEKQAMLEDWNEKHTSD